MKIKVYLDGPRISEVRPDDPRIDGYTTNPSLARKSGATNYEEYCRTMLAAAGSKPVSLEVIADDVPTMIRQARTIRSWGANAIVKIPVLNSAGESTRPVLEAMRNEAIPLNLTAVMDASQILPIRHLLFDPDWPVIVSVFAGRIADTGRNPVTAVSSVVYNLHQHRNVQVLWASTRQAYDIVQAQGAGCHIITVGGDLLAKTALLDKDLISYSAETAKQFLDDAVASGFTINC